jgi:predicted Zn-dependent protease
MTRLMTAKAQIDLAAGRTEAAVEEARRAIEQASRYHRLKYVCLSRLVLGEALLVQGRHEESVQETRAALAEADRLGHPPTQWRAGALLGRTLAAVADDDGAETAFKGARQTLERFADGLSAERRERFLAAAPVQEVLTLP